MRMLYEILKFVLRNMQLLHTGMVSEKIAAAMKLATVPAAFILVWEGVTKWYIVNQWFMFFVFFAVAADHALGTIVHLWWKKDFKMKTNIRGFFIKTGGSILGYVLFTMVHEILKEVPFIGDYFKIVIQLMVFIYPAGSAMGNLSIITGGKFPPIGWMNKLEKFQENLDLNNFKTTNINDETTTDDLPDGSGSDGV